MKISPWILLGGMLVVPCLGAESLYVARSKDHGAPFSLVMSEMKRAPSKSVVSVPGFHSRTAAGSRWLMCMYNDLAAKRGFKYWTVIYPDEPMETFPIALYQNPYENVEKLLGSDYAKERAFPPEPMSVDKWRQTLCAWMK